MGAIKDVIDLTTQLAERIEDRKFATDLFKIIRLINTAQTDQTILVEKNFQLMSDKSQMEQSISSLKAQVTELQNQILHLQKPTIEAQPTLSIEEQNILIFLSENTEEVEASEISHTINLNITKTEYWINNLESKEMVTALYASGSPIFYSIAQEGRKYLITTNLI